MTLSKKSKIIIIVAVVSIVVILSVSLGVYFGLFNDEKYKVDLEEVKKSTLLFEDNFDGNSLNPDNWFADNNIMGEDPDATWGVRRGGNWSKDNVIVEDGVLKIRTDYNETSGRYHSGAVSSAKLFDQKFGYFEIKCKLPKAYGIWSAFWLLNNEYGQDNEGNGRKYGAEIDIMEGPCWPKSKVQQAVHKGGYGDKTHTSIFNPRWVTESWGDIYDEFHTYGVFWNEDIYKFYVDDKCVWTTSYNNDVSQLAEYMIISVEIGGDDNFEPTKNPWTFVGGKPIIVKGNDKNLPADFIIDYVKVWDVSNFKDTNFNK